MPYLKKNLKKGFRTQLIKGKDCDINHNTVQKLCPHFYPFPAQLTLLWILLCLTPDDFTRQWGTLWAGKG